MKCTSPDRQASKRANAFKQALRQRGLYATVRQARNLGVSFIDCYIAVFGRMPRKL